MGLLSASFRGGLGNLAKRNVGRAMMDFGHGGEGAIQNRAFAMGEDMFRSGFQAKKDAIAQQIMANNAQNPFGQTINREIADAIRTAPDEPTLQALLQRLRGFDV